MKVLFLQSQFKMGGQQKVVKTIAESLSYDFDVTVYYENYNYFDLSSLNLIRPPKMIQFYNFFKIVLLNLMSILKNRRYIIDLWHLENIKSTFKNKKFDIVILCNPYILFSKEIKQITNAKKVVCWTHNIYENYVYSRFKDEKELLLKSMKNTDEIVCLENYTANKWRKVNDNITVINNPVTIETQNLKSHLYNKKICCVGRIQIDSKGLDMLCDVAEQLDDNITIDFAGSGHKKDEKKFKNLIRNKNVGKKINLLGPLNDKELVKHYSSASIFLICSRFEGFPLVVGEAMSFGLPIVAFDIPALREVTLNGKYGILVKKGDTKAMAKYINELMKNRAMLVKYQDLSIKRAKQLSLDKIRIKWENLLLGS